MLFNSLVYLTFLLPTVLAYWCLPPSGRLWLIFLASCVFYGFWRIEFLPLLLFSAVMDYGLALLIDRTECERSRFRLMLVSVSANLLILFFFKYFMFFRHSAFSLAHILGYEPTFIELKIILPLGISFYIFATLSYVIDVYRREFPAERNLLLYSCFVVYFPHLVAGPILRARCLIPQLRERPKFDLDFLTGGLARIVCGLFLKVVLADSLGGLVDEGFDRDPNSLSLLDCWTLAVLFGFQIYFDFSGYSHIAIGSSKLMGVILPENFNFPYESLSPREFWRHWHISLSTWIRDYIYLPIAGGYRRQGLRPNIEALAPEPGIPHEQRTIPLYLTWALMGLWHGANWTFVFWGLYHAFSVHTHRLVSAACRRIGFTPPAFLAWIVTFTFMMAGWIAFRSATVEQAMTMWYRMVHPSNLLMLTLLPNSYLAAASVMALSGGSYAVNRWLLPRIEGCPALNFAFEWSFYSLAFIGVIVYFRVTEQFVYFQF